MVIGRTTRMLAREQPVESRGVEARRVAADRGVTVAARPTPASMRKADQREPDREHLEAPARAEAPERRPAAVERLALPEMLAPRESVDPREQLDPVVRRGPLVGRMP